MAARSASREERADGGAAGVVGWRWEQCWLVAGSWRAILFAQAVVSVFSRGGVDPVGKPRAKPPAAPPPAINVRVGAARNEAE